MNTWCCAKISFLCAALASAQPVTPSPANGWELSAWLQQQLPQTGYYELLLDGNRPGNLTRRLVVYDIETGDLLMSSNGVMLVRDQDAAMVVVDGGRIVRRSDSDADPRGIGPSRVGRELPVLYAVWLLENPEYVSSVTTSKDGVISVRAICPREVGGEPLYEHRFEIDRYGAVLRAWQPDTKTESRRPEVFEYDPEFARERMVLTDTYLAWNWDVERRVVLDAAPHDAFADTSLVRMIREADTDPRAWGRDRVDAERAADGLDPVPLDPPLAEAIRRAKGQAPAWRGWLIGGGFGVMLLGVVLWWHRRPSSTA
ncbi:MAG: hypothetical protein ACF8GE_00020 [Phycisphaerales bacterium JB043]